MWYVLLGVGLGLCSFGVAYMIADIKSEMKKLDELNEKDGE